jgi:hypothetical protein
MFHLDVAKGDLLLHMFQLFQAGEQVAKQPGEQTGQAGE